MIRNKEKGTIRIQNRFQNCKHNIPKAMLEVICNFKELEFVEEVGVGRFFPTNKDVGGKITGFSDIGRAYLVTAVRGKFEQKFYLRVDSKNDLYEQKINDVLTKL